MTGSKDLESTEHLPPALSGLRLLKMHWPFRIKKEVEHFEFGLWPGFE